jgi:hypothetical protein
MDIPKGYRARPENTKFPAVIGHLKQFGNVDTTERPEARSVRARNATIIATVRDLLAVGSTHMRVNQSAQS